MSNDQIARRIYETLQKQRFTDWYEKIFVPSFIEEAGEVEDAINQIKKIFELDKSND